MIILVLVLWAPGENQQINEYCRPHVAGIIDSSIYCNQFFFCGNNAAADTVSEVQIKIELLTLLKPFNDVTM